MSCATSRQTGSSRLPMKCIISTNSASMVAFDSSSAHQYPSANCSRRNRSCARTITSSTPTGACVRRGSISELDPSMELDLSDLELLQQTRRIRAGRAGSCVLLGEADAAKYGHEVTKSAFERPGCGVGTRSETRELEHGT